MLQHGRYCQSGIAIKVPSADPSSGVTEVAECVTFDNEIKVAADASATTGAAVAYPY